MRNVNVISNMDLGKLPPQSIDIEEVVLGAIMLESESFIDVCDFLKPESFYKQEHQFIYESCQKLFNKNKPIDIMTVIEQLRIDKNLENIGGPAYITKLTGLVASGAHIEYHARIIHQKYIQRELIRISTETQNNAYDESVDVQELIDYTEQEIFNINNNIKSKGAKKLSLTSGERIKEIEEFSKSKEDFIGVPSGYVNLDTITRGFKPLLIIIAARPSMGKSAMVISMAKNMAFEFNKKVAIFSLEMGENEVSERFISNITGISGGKLNSKLESSSDDWSKLEYAQSLIEENDNIYIDDTPSLSLMGLRAKARRLKMQEDIDIIFIDYLQLMSGEKGTGKNREQEVSDISRGLKIMTKELGIPVIALSQLNRNCESRPDKKPMLSDLRESGAIEQDADIIMFLYRAAYYGFIQDEDGNSLKNRLDVIISKHRGGKLDTVTLWHDKDFTKISEKENQNIEPLPEFDNNEDIEPNEAF